MVAREKERIPTNRTAVASIGKGIVVLEALAMAGPRAMLSDLVRETGFDRATVHRILRSFIDAGYVERSGRGEYVVSHRAYLLGARLSSADTLVRVARPRVVNLQESLGETANLAVMDGTDIVYLVRAAVGRILSLNVEVGSRLPGFCASLGRAILAYLPESEAEAILERSDRVAYTKYTRTSVPDLLEVLRHVRKRGYALTNQEFEIGLCSMACPVFSHTGVPVGAINIAVSAGRISPSEMVRRFSGPLQKSCDEISRELGWHTGIVEMGKR